MTEMDVTARKATGVPRWFGKYAGKVISAANITTNRTDQVGVLFFPSRRQRLWPGTAPSRENANVMRDALVRQATPQKSCPTVEIRITAFAAARLSAVEKIARAGNAALTISVSWLFWIATVMASRTIQPITAEWKTDRPTPCAHASSAPCGSAGRG